MDSDDKMMALLDIFPRLKLELGEDKDALGDRWYMLPWEEQLQGGVTDANTNLKQAHGMDYTTTEEEGQKQAWTSHKITLVDLFVNYLRGSVEAEEFQMDLKTLKQNIFFMRKIARDQMGADKTEEVMGESCVFTPDEGTGVMENDTGEEKEEHSHENMGAHDDMEESIPESPKKIQTASNPRQCQTLPVAQAVPWNM